MGFKLCVIGCGYMAEAGHGPAYKKYALLNPDVELSACCDVEDGRAEAFQQKFGFNRHYTDYEVMLDKERPDAVCLIVPAHLTAVMAVSILHKGYPLFLEKPPGLNREETLQMIEVAEKMGVPNQVAFNRRHMPLVKRLKELLNGKFPPQRIQNLQCNFYRYNRLDADFAATAIHGIDTVKFIAGSDYEVIHFQYQELESYGKKATNIFMDCRFRSGASAQLSFCPVSGLVAERYTVHAPDNTFFLATPVWNGFDTPGRLIHIQEEKILLDCSGADLADASQMSESNGFYAENEAFLNDIRAGRKPVDTIQSGLQSVEIADLIRNRCDKYYGL